MKKSLIVAICATILYACTEAGDGSEVTKDSTGTKKDTMIQVNSDGSTTTKDTSSYERMPNKTAGDSTK
ncbi:MAG: hypothetical protein EOO01_35865 [Chitinophagaceae bacterium]|nr:MAG: hypothetical protein EOO01_35865 [Chitinophagaceae bacterium]